MLLSFAKTGHFYPRSPRGERLTTNGSISGDYEFLSTLPARGATTRKPDGEGGYTISIHAPREGSDFCLTNYDTTMEISIHAPREGSDMPAKCSCIGSNGFLSTLPARGATRRRWTGCPVRPNFYPRSPRGERHACKMLLYRVKRISIHAPREGSDDTVCPTWPK